jgi:two-component system NarL family response regulator
MIIKVAIVEDQKKTLNSLAILLDGAETLEVVGRYSSGEEALKGVMEVTPDVFLVDLGLPGISGVELIRELKELVPDLEILVLTIFEDRDHLFPALKAGASGYLLKDSTPSEIIESIEEIVNGGSPMSSRIARLVVEALQDNESIKERQNYSLTRREKEVLRGLINGLTYKMVAEELCVSPHTVRTHIKNIYEKLHVRSKWEAIEKVKRDRVL